MGNDEFCSFVERRVSPAGGIRVWNDFDAVPYLAQLVGFRHAGVPIRLLQQESCRQYYSKENINETPPVLSVVTPHILYQIGPLVHVFPVLGVSELSEGVAD